MGGPVGTVTDISAAPGYKQPRHPKMYAQARVRIPFSWWLSKDPCIGKVGTVCLVDQDPVSGMARYFLAFEETRRMVIHFYNEDEIVFL